MTTNAHSTSTLTLTDLGPDSPAEDLRAVYEQGGATVAELMLATGTSRARVEDKLRRAETRMRPPGRRSLHPVRGRSAPIETVRTCAVSASSPIVLRHVLAKQLRKLRAQAGLTQSQAGRRAQISHSALSRVERPLSTPMRVSLLYRLCQIYEAPSLTHEKLFRLWQDSNLPPWWEQQHLHVPDENERTILGIRADAQRVHGWAETLVPELLRTSAYESAIAGSTGTAGQRQMAVAVSLAAQRRARQRGVEQRYVVDETVIRRPVGGPQVMADQISVLRGVAEQGRLRVLAWSSGHYPLENPFELCAVPGLDTVLYHPRARTMHMDGAFEQHDTFIRFWGQAEDQSATLALLDDAYARLSATTTPTVKDRRKT